MSSPLMSSSGKTSRVDVGALSRPPDTGGWPEVQGARKQHVGAGHPMDRPPDRAPSPGREIGSLTAVQKSTQLSRPGAFLDR